MGPKQEALSHPAGDGNLGVGIVIGTLVSGRAGASRTAGESPAIGKPLAIPDPVVMSSTFSAIVKKVEPAVVNISTTQVIEQAHRPVRPRANGGQGGNGANGGGMVAMARMARVTIRSRIISTVSLAARIRVATAQTVALTRNAAWARA